MKEMIIVYNNSGSTKLMIKELKYVEVYGHTLSYHSEKRDVSSTGSKSISWLEQELAENDFIRCHQGYLVNLRYVTRCDNDKIYVGDAVIPLSRSRKRNFREALDMYRKNTRN